MDSATLTGTIRELIRKERRPAAYEARVASSPDASGRVFVTSRALTGSGHRLGPFQARHLHTHDDEGDVVNVSPGDAVFLVVDESGEPSHLSGRG